MMNILRREEKYMYISSSTRPIGFKSINYNSLNNKKNNVTNKNTMSKKAMETSLGEKLKKNSLLENLTKQKEKLMERKTSIMEKALEKGESPESIKEKLETIDKQIEEIDKQLSEIQLENQRKSMGTKNNDEKNKKSKKSSNNSSTKHTQMDESLNNIVHLSNGLTKAKTTSSQRNIMVSNARKLEAEIEDDERLGVYGNIKIKRHELSKINDNIKNITKKLASHLTDINNKTNDNDNDEQNNYLSTNEKHIKDYKSNLDININEHGEKVNIIV